MRFHSDLIYWLKVFAASFEDQIALMDCQNYRENPKKLTDELEEALDSFFEAMVPIETASGDWRARFPKLSIFEEKIPENWWENQKVVSVEALRDGIYWKEMRVLAKQAIGEA